MVRVCSGGVDQVIPLIDTHIDKNSVDKHVQRIITRNSITHPNLFKEWLLKAVSVVDLTTLSGDDTPSNVSKLCIKAANPINSNKNIRTAAVCVYPNRVEDAFHVIKRMDLLKELHIASVATGFPSGLYPLNTRVQEIEFAVSKGANEIDVVLDRSLVLTGQWKKLYNEVVEMKKACSNAHLKVILGVGDLGTYENVYNASMVAMYAGADFIKTSTGKEAVNATLPIGLVMCRAIRNYYRITGIKIGLKPAGGIKTARDAVNWLILVHTELGPEWLSPKLFRIGASSLLTEIEKELETPSFS